MGKNFTIYIKGDNLDQWEAEPNKSALVNGFLSTRGAVNSLSAVTSLEPLEEAVDTEVAKIAKKAGVKTCQHGAAIGFCKFGCKK